MEELRGLKGVDGKLLEYQLLREKIRGLGWHVYSEARGFYALAHALANFGDVERALEALSKAQSVPGIDAEFQQRVERYREKITQRSSQSERGFASKGGLHWTDAIPIVCPWNTCGA